MKVPYSPKEIEKATSRFMRNKHLGLCSSFVTAQANSYQQIPKFLRALGGKSKWEWFWLEPYYHYWNNIEKEKVIAARNQRATMLAFMLVWSNDPDFEV